MFTPFAHCAPTSPPLEVRHQPGVANYIATGDTELVRAHADCRRRVPLSVHQRAAVGHADDRADRAADRAAERDADRPVPQRRRPEPDLRRRQPVPVDKFSGWDRVEGGGRVNAGLQYTAQVNRGRLLQRAVRSVLPAVRRRTPSRSATSPIPASTAASTSTVSDYVGAGLLSSRTGSTPFTSRGRFDQSTFAVQRFELESRANFDRWSLQVLYGNYAAQPRARLPDPARGHPWRRPAQAHRELGLARFGPLRPPRR